MKCSRCGTDNTLKDRTRHRGRCKHCNHPFVFEPSTMQGVRFTDPFFAKALTDLSARNTLYFTPRQLFFFLEKRLRKRVVTGAIATTGLAWMLIIVGLFLSAAGIGVLMIIAGVGLLLLGWIRSRLPSKTPPHLVIEPAQVEGWMRRWTQVNPPPDKLLPPPRQRSTLPRAAPLSADITAYSFDRLVVCDQVAIAQMLIANNFHFENNCAVLTISGYPEPIFATTLQMVRRNPDLRVFALHDCSPSGMTVVPRLRTDPTWFAGSEVVIVDIGLLPRQVMAARRTLTIQNSPRATQESQDLDPDIRRTLSAPELQWLDSGNVVELESFTPQALIQILQRMMSRTQDIESGDSMLWLPGDPGYGYTYAVDSFG